MNTISKYLSKQGAKGGNATKAKYGKEYYKIIAKKPRKKQKIEVVDKSIISNT